MAELGNSEKSSWSIWRKTQIDSKSQRNMGIMPTRSDFYFPIVIGYPLNLGDQAIPDFFSFCFFSFRCSKTISLGVAQRRSSMTLVCYRHSRERG